MKNILTTVLSFFVLVFSMGSCVPDDNYIDAIGERNLIIAVDPNPGTASVQTLGSTYGFRVIVESPMPPQGVEVTVTYTRDRDGHQVFSQNYRPTATPLSVTITNIEFDEPGTVMITVTSLTDRNNTATKSFKLIRK